MKLLLWLLSPHALLTGIFVSYFTLLFTADFVSKVVAKDLFVLGLVSIFLSYIIFERKFAPLRVTELLAGRVMAIICFLLFPVAVYLWSLFGLEFAALVDTRFSVAGFGIISSLYFVCAFIGTCILSRVRSVFLIIVFFLLVFYSGFQIGGKGFVAPLLFGFSLSVSLGLQKVTPGRILGLSFAAVVTIFLALFDKWDSVENAIAGLALRVTLAADAVNWISQLSMQDIGQFPIDTFTFVADIPLRFVGSRIHARSVGSEIAFMVAGDESGGGPNANLPVLAYLVNQGNVGTALLFVLGVFLFAKIMADLCKRKRISKRKQSVFHAAILFLAPTVAIDLVVFLQYLFWILLIGFLVSVIQGVIPYLAYGKGLKDAEERLVR